MPPAPDYFPYGIYAVPEISTVGMSEEEVRRRGIPYECGIARFRETSRGHIMGLNNGMMKMIFSLKTRRLLGVHIVGEGATELVHIGQAVLNLHGTLDYFIENTFNYPTLAEAYKIAALDAWNRMGSDISQTCLDHPLPRRPHPRRRPSRTTLLDDLILPATPENNRHAPRRLLKHPRQRDNRTDQHQRPDPPAGRIQQGRQRRQSAEQMASHSAARHSPPPPPASTAAPARRPSTDAGDGGEVSCSPYKPRSSRHAPPAHASHARERRRHCHGR